MFNDEVDFSRVEMGKSFSGATCKIIAGALPTALPAMKFTAGNVHSTCLRDQFPNSPLHNSTLTLPSQGSHGVKGCHSKFHDGGVVP